MAYFIETFFQGSDETERSNMQISQGCLVKLQMLELRYCRLNQPDAHSRVTTIITILIHIFNISKTYCDISEYVGSIARCIVVCHGYGEEIHGMSPS